ncbi:hypothetical protein EUA93_11615 [Nocardioides oleivorans]|uniref:Uncharacterized protein n=1 Tax=Nocardioides oleivorans TaxID=273676 RepID=A0A4Q2S176_9ACTN|nr:hypothetical protein [Nocardioides oleivorans]RYB94936.1 hypothetical protein EUA93_11615 [Nocardioides oleivorans]
MTDDGGTPALDALAELAREQAEHDAAAARLGPARARLAAATDRSESASSDLAGELEDVARLEQLSLTRILPTLRGRRDLDLDREKAEAQAAQYVAAEAEARREAAQADVDSLVAQLARSGDLAARRADLLVAREAEVAADPSRRETAAQLDSLATELGRHRARRTQLEEAISATHAAARTLDEAARHLGGADDWASVDTFLGGGLFTDMVKYHRIDDAAARMREADAALGHLATELADVGMSAVGGIEVTDLTTFFDVWFDNIFSDWAVRNRVREAAARVAQARLGVEQTGTVLGTRLTECTSEIEVLEQRRESLLA